MRANIPTNDCFLIDWFSFTSKIDDVNTMVDRLCLPEACVFKAAINVGGKYGYSETYSFGNINIYSGHFKEAGVMVDMSGQGCRTYDTYSSMGFLYLMQLIAFNSDRFNITRIDIAYDDHSGCLEFNELIKASYERSYVSKWRTNTKTAFFNGKYEEWSVMYGRKSSDIYMRFYDKAAERGYDSREEHWIRTEIVLKHQRAAAFITEYLADSNLGRIFFGILNNYLRFVEKDEEETNVSRLVNTVWWDKFLKFVLRIKLFVKRDTEYNLHRLQKYLLNQAGNCLDVIRHTIGWDVFEEQVKNRQSTMNSRQLQLISDYNESYANFLLNGV